MIKKIENIDRVDKEDNEVNADKSASSPPPLYFPNHSLTTIPNTPTLLLVSPAYLSSHRISTIDDVGLLAIFLITANNS